MQYRRCIVLVAFFKMFYVFCELKHSNTSRHLLFLLLVNQSYDHLRTTFEVSLNTPTVTEVFASLSWLVSLLIRVITEVLIDSGGRGTLNGGILIMFWACNSRKMCSFSIYRPQFYRSFWFRKDRFTWPLTPNNL